MENLKITEQFGHQGDTQWYKIDVLPKGLKKLSNQFIAKSEKSGSVHVLCGNYEMYEYEDGFVMDVKEDCVLNHTFQSNLANNAIKKAKELPKKDHRHSVIPKGYYVVGIQRRYDPLERIMKKVVD